ncbi:hypothetical protein AHF37_04507 [Paragonimus kellicotti]|nr:hypothetical protein AHF37_04507 [Paragonimus kellicotti]
MGHNFRVTRRGNSVDPDFLVADSQSSTSGYPGRDSGSESASNVSVTRKPRVTRDRNSSSSSQSTVTRLPAYRTLGGTLTTQNTRQRHHFPSALSVGPSSDQNSELRHTPPHGVNSDSMEMVLRAATHVHQTRVSFRFVQKLRPNSKGESVLHRAAIRGNMDQVKSLLASGLSPNVRDHAGWMPLHEAVLHGHRDIAEALLKAGATVDAPGGPDLDTPLHDAIQNAQAACCELLLAHGANPVLPNAMGMTPLQLVDSQLGRLALPSPKSKRHLPSVAPKNAAIVNQLHNVRIALLKAISQPRTSPETDKREENTHNLVPDLISLVKTVNQTTFIERRRLRPVLLATGLSRLQQATFARVATMIHAQIATSISPEVTHVITGASQEIIGMDRSGQMSLVRTSSKPRGRVSSNSSTGAYQANCPRTLKFLNAVLQGPFVYPVPPRAELVTLARSGGATVVLSRERCSPLRLARLAVEVADLSATSSSCASWEVVESSSFGAMEEDHEEDSDGDRSLAHDAGTSTSNAISSPLLVFYDPGQHSTLAHAKAARPTPYAVQTVSQALTLLKPRTDRVSPADPPLRVVPSTWLLDCAAEYTILPFPNL